MRPVSLETELLGLLAQAPFLDRQEMACISGGSRSVVYEAVHRLEEGGLVDSIPHAADLAPPARRYCLTTDGVRRLAQDQGTTVDGLLRSCAVSQQWGRILLERLDAIASIYRLASAVASAASPIGLRLYRAAPLDAAITLPEGRTLGVVRQGPAADRTAFAKRLWRLGQGPLPGASLVLVSDEVRLRHARRLLARTPVNALLALERDAVLAGLDAPVWRPPPSGVRPRAARGWTWATCWSGCGPAASFPKRNRRRRRSFPATSPPTPAPLWPPCSNRRRSAPWTGWPIGPGCCRRTWRACWESRRPASPG